MGVSWKLPKMVKAKTKQIPLLDSYWLEYKAKYSLYYPQGYIFPRLDLEVKQVCMHDHANAVHNLLSMSWFRSRCHLDYLCIYWINSIPKIKVQYNRRQD